MYGKVGWAGSQDAADVDAPGSCEEAAGWDEPPGVDPEAEDKVAAYVAGGRGGGGGRGWVGACVHACEQTCNAFPHRARSQGGSAADFAPQQQGPTRLEASGLRPACSCVGVECACGLAVSDRRGVRKGSTPAVADHALPAKLPSLFAYLQDSK